MEPKHYTTRKTCRACYSNDLEPIFSLGEHYVNDFPEPHKQPSPESTVPIDLELCNACRLVQAKHTTPQEFLYSRHYWYRSGITQIMREALREVASTIEDMGILNPGDVVLDIGSNDGTLLRSFALDGLNLVGVEPARNLAAEGCQGLDHFINEFWDYETYHERVGKKAKVITALGMFYDLEDPNQFIADVSKALDNDGIFVAQLMCLHNMLELNDIGNFAHEHLEFYSIQSLDHLLGKHGLKIVHLETNDVNGRSYRLYIRPKTSCQHCKPSPSLTQAREDETYYLENPKHLQSLFHKMEDNKQTVRDFIRTETLVHHKTVWVYGASTKGNTILQYYELDYPLIQGAAEKSQEKWGRETVGTRIPIYSEEEARKACPNYFLVLPYAFIDEFIQRERQWLEGGGKFIVPIPKMRIIGKEAL